MSIIDDYISADSAVNDKNAVGATQKVDEAKAGVEVGPPAQTGYGDRLDQTRPTDKAVLSDVSKQSLKNAMGPKVKLNPLEQAVGEISAGATEAGKTPEQLLTQAHTVDSAVKQQPLQYGSGIATTAENTVVDYSLSAGFNAQIKAEQAVAKRSDELLFGDLAASAFRLNSITQALYDRTIAPDFEADPTYDYMARRDEVEKGMTEEDRQYMRESVSPADEQYRLSVIQKRQQDLSDLGSQGSAVAIAAGLTGGLVDPAGWVIGLGVGKGAQLLGVGSQAAFEAGNVARGIGYAAAEGAAANVLTEAALDASGGHVTHSDYLYSAGFGAVFGQLGLIQGLKSAGNAGLEGAARQVAGEIDNTLMDGHVQYRDAYQRAAAAADAGATEVPPIETVPVADVPVFTRELRRRTGEGEYASRTPETTVKTELSRIAQDAENPMRAEIAKRWLDQIGDDIPVHKNAKLERSYFSNGDYYIGMRAAADDNVMMHEIAHSMTADRLRYGRANPESTMGKLAAEIDALHTTASDIGNNMPFRNKATKYYLSNADEFIAGLFSGPGAREFHQFLQGINVTPTQTLFGRLVQIVRKSLGIKEDQHNAFTKAFDLVDELNNQPLIIKQKVVGARGGNPREIQVQLHNDALVAGQQMQTNGLDNLHNDLVEAQARLPEPTPADIKRELDQIQRDRFSRAMSIVHAAVNPIDRFLPVAGPELGDNGLPVVTNAMPPELQAEIGARWGITEDTVEDATTRNLLIQQAAAADRWNVENPIDFNRVNSILLKAPWLASTGLQMAKSTNPLARMIAGVLLENTTGAVGRRRTAAIDKVMLQRQYDDYLGQAEQHYTAWRNRNGGGVVNDLLRTKHRETFNRLVAVETENQRLGVSSSEADPDVLGAVKALTAGYDRMRTDLQTRNVIGAARLGDSSYGYSPRRFSKGWLLGATPEERIAVSRAIRDQLAEVWGDPEFAARIAARYMDRASQEAAGGVEVPANLYQGEALAIIDDLLRADKTIDPEQIDRLMGRFSRGGASFTKTRLDLDLNDTVSLPNGQEFRLGDAFVSDFSKLYQQYSRRASGEAALSMYGIYGELGMKLLRRGMEFGPNGVRADKHVLEAFDQVHAEFFGRGPNGSKALGNLRMLAASSRLGGMGFQQFAETANGVSALGLASASRVVADLPRLIQDVRLGRPGPVLESIELIGGPIGQDHKVVFPYQELNDHMVYGANDLTTFDRLVRGGSQLVPWASGFHYLHAAQVRGMTEQIVMKSMRYINGGMEDAALDSMGITASLRARIRADLPNIAEFDSAGTLTKLDLTATRDPAATKEYVDALHRGASQIIQNTFIGETGKWAHNDLLRLLAQFRTFGITSMEKQWTRQRNDFGTIKAFGLLAGMMAFALPIHLARLSVNAALREDSADYLEKQTQPMMLARNLLNYPSITGLAPDIFDSGAIVLGLDVSGGRSGSQSSALDAVPALGYINSFVSAVKDRDPRELIRSLPGQNLPFLVPLVNLTDN